MTWRSPGSRSWRLRPTSIRRKHRWAAHRARALGPRRPRQRPIVGAVSSPGAPSRKPSSVGRHKECSKPRPTACSRRKTWRITVPPTSCNAGSSTGAQTMNGGILAAAARCSGTRRNAGCAGQRRRAPRVRRSRARRHARSGSGPCAARRSRVPSQRAGWVGDCIEVLDLEARLPCKSERGQQLSEVSDLNGIRGCDGTGLWQRRSNTEAWAGGPGRFVAISHSAASTPKRWGVQVTPITGAEGRPAGQTVVRVTRHH